jgi:hypothetical protein
MLTWIFLESTVALGVLSALAMFVLLVMWRRSLNPRPLLIGLLLTAMLFAIQGLVTTPREHFNAMMGPVERGVEDSDAAAVSRPFFADFSAGDMNRESFTGWVAAQLARIDVAAVRRLRSQVEPDGDSAWVAEAAYSGMITTPEIRGQLITCSWRIWFRREPDGKYVITRIEPIKVNGQSIRDWQTLERL